MGRPVRTSSSVSRSSLQYGQFGSEQYGDPDSALCADGLVWGSINALLGVGIAYSPTVSVSGNVVTVEASRCALSLNPASGERFRESSGFRQFHPENHVQVARCDKKCLAFRLAEVWCVHALVNLDENVSDVFTCLVGVAFHDGTAIRLKPPRRFVIPKHNLRRAKRAVPAGRG
jgi:hypothetical protein